MDYYVRFTGHLKAGSRPKGWPRVVVEDFIVQSETKASFFEYLEQRANQIKREHGMTVNREQAMFDEYTDDEKGIEGDRAFGTGVFVPMHMIAFVSYAVKPLISVMPLNEGVVQ